MKLNDRRVKGEKKNESFSQQCRSIENTTTRSSLRCVTQHNECIAVCERIDQSEFSGDIVEEIKRLIHASIGVIVDLSELKENVLYEAGFAHALQKPTVHICSTDLSGLPFDVRNWNTIPYTLGGTMNLRQKLAARLAAVV